MARPGLFTSGKEPWDMLSGRNGPRIDLDVVGEMSVVPVGIRTQDIPAHSLLTIPNTLHGLNPLCRN